MYFVGDKFSDSSSFMVAFVLSFILPKLFDICKYVCCVTYLYLLSRSFSRIIIFSSTLQKITKHAADIVHSARKLRYTLYLLTLIFQRGGSSDIIGKITGRERHFMVFSEARILKCQLPLIFFTTG